MKLIIVCILMSCSALVFAQHKKPFTGYLGVEYIRTTEDATKPNNPGGAGAFLTVYGNTGTLRPVLDLAGDIFLGDDKVGRIGPSDELLPRIDALWTVMGGIAVHPDDWLNVGFLTGPAVVNGDVLWAIKPFVEVLPGRNGLVAMRLSYLQTRKRVPSSSVRHYSAITVGLGFRIFGKDMNLSHE